MNDILNGLNSIISEYKESQDRKVEFELGFNVFSLMSNTYHRENFHSEIICSLLNPEGKHGEGMLFLDLFLDFLKVDKSNYRDVIKVFNEYGIDNQRRIDILICSKTNAIIIENKINNAVDMNNQLVDYYEHCMKEKLHVDTILYLSLDGIKAPDQTKWHSKEYTKNEIKARLEKMSAFNIGDNKDSLYHWLEKCEVQSKIKDNQFIIKHYKQLIKSLRGHIMETAVLKKYYEYFLQNIEYIEGAVDGESLEIHNSLVYYYPEKLKEIIDNDTSITEYFDDNEIFARNSVIFKNNEYQYVYYLKVSFESNKRCTIQIMDNTKTWQYDSKLKEDKEIVDIFSNQDHAWVLNQTEFDLINNFNELTDLVKHVLLKIILIIVKNQK